MIIRPLASGSAGNAYYISDGTPLLIECGIPWKMIQQALEFRTSERQAASYPGHQDHCKAVKDVIKAGIDVYLSPALGLSGHRVKPIEAKRQFQVGTWLIKPFETQHDCEGSLGFLLYSTATREKLVYITDSFYSRYVFPGLTHIMVECNYSLDILRENVANGTVVPELKNRIVQSHFSLENVKEFLRANDLTKVKEIWLIHLSEGNSDAPRFKREIMALTGKPVHAAGERGII